MRTRQDVIDAATGILRESGPSALTSVAVAKRLGVTQPAVYRHVRDMEELTTLASRAVIGELSSVLIAAATAPETTWGDGSHLTAFAEQMIELARQHQHAFETIERWRYHVSELGEGIRTTLRLGAEMIKVEFEAAWREDFRSDVSFDAATQAAQRIHASLLVDDIVAAGRLVRSSTESQRHVVTHVLSLRLFTGWCGYVLETNTRVGLPIPELGSAQLSSPRLATA